MLTHLTTHLTTKQVLALVAHFAARKPKTCALALGGHAEAIECLRLAALTDDAAMLAMAGA